MFKYKNNYYIIVAKTSFKHPDTRKWIKAYMYIGTSKFALFVREQQDFKNRFQRITLKMLYKKFMNGFYI